MRRQCPRPATLAELYGHYHISYVVGSRGEGGDKRRHGCRAKRRFRHCDSTRLGSARLGPARVSRGISKEGGRRQKEKGKPHRDSIKSSRGVNDSRYFIILGQHRLLSACACACAVEPRKPLTETKERFTAKLSTNKKQTKNKKTINLHCYYFRPL